MHQARSRIHSDVQLHPEVVLISLLHLPHLRVPLSSPVLGRGRRFYDGDVHDGSLPQPHPLLCQVTFDFLNQSLAQFMPLQQVATMKDGAPIGDRFRQPQPSKTPHRFRFVQQVFHGWIAQVVAQLDDMHPQHHRQGIGPPTPLCTEIMGSNTIPQPLLGNQGVHTFRKLFPAGPAPLVLIVRIGEGGLLVHLPPFPISMPCSSLIQSFLSSKCSQEKTKRRA